MYGPFWCTCNNHFQKMGQWEEYEWRVLGKEGNGMLPPTRPPIGTLVPQE
jgi:hypothetical protein